MLSKKQKKTRKRKKWPVYQVNPVLTVKLLKLRRLGTCTLHRGNQILQKLKGVVVKYQKIAYPKHEVNNLNKTS